MPVMIQLRNVPDDLHRKLKARAAAAGMSLSDYILRDVAKTAEQPTMEEWLRMVKKLKPIKTRESSAEAIRAIRDSR
jgi:plasmid stability protein